MAFLTPDEIYITSNGIEVSRKFYPGRPGTHLLTPDNNPEYVTIHNTEDINEAPGTNDAEQYARATFNGNMNGVTVHFYIDETACWQTVPMNERAYHAADGKDGPGNGKSVAIEIIMDGSGKDYDVKAEQRGALLAAWLLHKYGLGIDRLKTHSDWYPKKTCPVYILPHWDKFKAQVEKNLAEIKKQDEAAAQKTEPAIKKHYRLQVGYYEVKENAVEMQKKLKAAGFDSIIKEE